MTNLLVALFALGLAATQRQAPGRRRTLSFLASLTALIVCLVAQSPTRPVGDAREYVLMAINLARLDRPSATADDLARIPTMFPGVTAEGLTRPTLRRPDGRQDFPTFWFYPLLAAPFAGAARMLGAHPVTGFAVFNILLLLGVALLLLERTTPAVALFVVAGPILWWVDKAHPEILTFSMITAGLTMLPSAPWWSVLAFGIAATQSPIAAVAMLVATVYAFYSNSWRDRRAWGALLAGAVLVSLHPLYSYSRLGLWSGLYEGVDRHWPTWRELMVVAFDPNLGMFVHDPLLFLAMVISFVEAITRPRRRAPGTEHGARAIPAAVWPGLIALLFLVGFTQTMNVNSGGTPSPSRFGLWLIPFAVPVLARVPERSRWIKVLAAGSVAWCVWAFAPVLPDQYLRPTTLAAVLWQRQPDLDNPLAEIFAERAAGQEPAKPPVATPGCEKVLLWSDGSGAAWPTRCTPAELPGFCQVKDALCYANRTASGYHVVQAQSPPAWLAAIDRGEQPRFTGGMLTITQTVEPKMPMAVWYEDGWSYPEGLSDPAADPLAREWRWMGERAAIGVMSTEPVGVRMKLVARSLTKPRRVRVSVGGSEIMTLLVGTSQGEYQTSAFKLPSGTSAILLESLDGTDTPGDNDSRKLSIAVFRIELAVGRTP